MAKTFSTKVYVVPGAHRPFYHQRDAKNFCEDAGIDFKEAETFDSIGEYKRWLFLMAEQSQGRISKLKRQVSFEIIPPKSAVVEVGTKAVKYWCGRLETGARSPYFKTKTEVKRWARRNNITEYTAVKHEEMEPVMKEKVIEKAAYYTADFTYHRNGEYVVEDVKSDFTRKEKDYVLRRKLMLHVHNIRIFEYIT